MFCAIAKLIEKNKLIEKDVNINSKCTKILQSIKKHSSHRRNSHIHKIIPHSLVKPAEYQLLKRKIRNSNITLKKRRYDNTLVILNKI